MLAHYYSADPVEEREMRRYAFLSAFTLRTDAEEAEAQTLCKKYAERTGWPLLPRECPSSHT